MNELEKLKETILKEYPRMSLEDSFQFECGHHLDCFNNCCSDVNIFLTPYDVLRMRQALKMTSTDFLGKYTLIPFDENQNLPVPLLTMKDDEIKGCHFVDKTAGCTIYQDRPWPCRMYPIGLASPSNEPGAVNERFYFLMREDVCHGLGMKRDWTVQEWIQDQGIEPYDEFGELFKEITLHRRFNDGFKPNPKHIEIYWMGLYDIDRFRQMIFESSFLSRVDIPQADVEKLKEDDETLLRLGFNWVKTALFGEKSLPIKPEAIAKAHQRAESTSK